MEYSAGWAGCNNGCSAGKRDASWRIPGQGGCNGEKGCVPRDKSLSDGRNGMSWDAGGRQGAMQAWGGWIWRRATGGRVRLGEPGEGGVKCWVQ